MTEEVPDLSENINRSQFSERGFRTCRISCPNVYISLWSRELHLWCSRTLLWFPSITLVVKAIIIFHRKHSKFYISYRRESLQKYSFFQPFDSRTMNSVYPGKNNHRYNTGVVSGDLRNCVNTIVRISILQSSDLIKIFKFVFSNF